MTPTRPVAIVRLVFTLGVAVLVGTMLVLPVEAAKKVASVKVRVQAMRDVCEIVGGGTLTVVQVGKATVTDCNGGASDGYRCVFTKGTPSACHQAYTPPPPPDEDVAPPPSGVAPPAGGGDSPTGGGDSTSDGGAGGSGLTPPGTATDNPSVADGGGGGVVHIASRGGEHDPARDHGKHQRQRHGKGRQG
jgi:hypothetical protein